MEYAMTNMQSDLTDLKDHLQKISSVHSADMEHQNPQPYSETIPLDDSFWENSQQQYRQALPEWSMQCSQQQYHAQ